MINFSGIKKVGSWVSKNINAILIGIAIVVPLVAACVLFADRLRLENKLTSTFYSLEREVVKLQAGISQNDIRQWNILGVQKWIEKNNKKLNSETCYSYATLIVNESERQKIDVSLILSIIEQESHYSSNAESWAGAVGLMGIMPETGAWIARELGVTYSNDILKTPEMSIRMGTWFIAYLLQKYGNDTISAAAHYNGGNKQQTKYVMRQRYKNTDEYKLSIPQLDKKLSDMKAELIASGKNEDEFRYDEKYKYTEDVYLGKTLEPETENYIPSVMSRMRNIRHFLSNPSGVH